jgi:proteasome lid subunit RPN8/RPN11
VFQRQIAEEARVAFPHECCGLLEGVRNGAAITVTALHPAENLSQDDDRFEIDPADHFAALRSARVSGHEIVGCYHSHPNGKAEPSARDSESSWDEGFVWVIAAAGEGPSITAHLRAGDGWRRLEIVEKAA